jgi:glycosyltransferase involved in cell wall biosynthesis
MSEHSPLVSICITSYNYGRYLRDAIESALAQSYRNIEVVVSDNGSTDVTNDVLASYAQDPRVRVFVNETNIGLCRNHNEAIRRSRGEYIVVLSADDVIFPQHVALLMARINDANDPVRIASGQGMELTETLEPLGPLLTLGNIPLAYSRRDEFGSLVYNYHHVFPARLIARSVYEEVGLFDETIITSIDIELCARIEQADIPSAFVPVFVCGLRQHGSRRSVRSRSRMNEMLNDKLCVAERALLSQNAWRIEGYERGILDVFAIEEQQLAERDEEPLHFDQRARLENMRTLLDERMRYTPEWPATEPKLTVVVLSDGYLQLLYRTFEALIEQHVERLEILVLQVSGCDVEAWVRCLPFASRVRVIQARACQNQQHAFRYGMDLARGEFVTYLSEGQIIASDLYDTILNYAREVKPQMLVVPKSSIRDDFMFAMPQEHRGHQFAAPAERARLRAEGGPYGLCQLTHRRGLFRCSQVAGTSFYDIMVACDESVFVQALSEQYQTVLFSMEATAA